MKKKIETKSKEKEIEDRMEKDFEAMEAYGAPEQSDMPRKLICHNENFALIRSSSGLVWFINKSGFTPTGI